MLKGSEEIYKASNFDVGESWLQFIFVSVPGDLEYEDFKENMTFF